MSERVKVIHVVGQTTRAMQKNHMMIHHSIGDKPDHQQYNKASAGLRFAAAELWDIETAPGEIDRVIKECFIQSGPVYIFLPLDLSAEEVPADLLKSPIDIEPKVDEKSQERAVSAIFSALKEAKHPSILVDALVQRFNATQEATALVEKLKVPFFSANMGKGVVDETLENYIGVWSGEIGTPGVATAAKASDLIITLGYIPADTNSGGFTRDLKKNQTIHINPLNTVVKGQEYPNTYIKPLLEALIRVLPSEPIHKVPKAQLPPPRTPIDTDAKHITQSWLFPTFESFLNPNDVLLGETGTTMFGLFDINFPEKTHFITQIYYGSIGYATAATLGVDIAKKEMGLKGRTILITGDGSMAMTIQEVGTMVKQGLNPIIFVINNEGYTVERMIWGAQQGRPSSNSYIFPSPISMLVLTDYSVQRYRANIIPISTSTL